MLLLEMFPLNVLKLISLPGLIKVQNYRPFRHSANSTDGPYIFLMVEVDWQV